MLINLILVIRGATKIRYCICDDAREKLQLSLSNWRVIIHLPLNFCDKEGKNAMLTGNTCSRRILRVSIPTDFHMIRKRTKIVLCLVKNGSNA